VGGTTHERREFVFGDVEIGGDLRTSGAAVEFGLEARPGVTGPCDVIAGIDGKPDGAGRIGDAALDGLADPTGRVRRKFETLTPIELVDSTEQPEIPLLDEVKE